jgi:6-phosphogluconolactonase
MKIKTYSVIFFFSFFLICSDIVKAEFNNNRNNKKDCYVYVSVNSEKKIVIYRLDPEKGELVLKGEQDLSGTPGSLCSDRAKGRMYAALRDINSVASLEIDKETGSLSHLNDTPVADNPVYISTDKKGKFLFFTSYNGNRNAVYPIGKEGVVKDAVQILEARINPHMIRPDASGKYVFVPNKGGDVVQQFIFKGRGVLQPNNPEAVPAKSGSGPRHFTINPAGNIMYVVNELSCTVVAFHLNRKEGILTGPFQEVTTKPADHTSYNTCADIHITPDGKFLYASNRGHDSLAGFSVDQHTGKLTPIGWFPTEKEPREFEIDPSGRYVISAGESSGGIALYSINTDGTLKMLKSYYAGHWPVWVLALEL